MHHGNTTKTTMKTRSQTKRDTPAEVAKTGTIMTSPPTIIATPDTSTVPSTKTNKIQPCGAKGCLTCCMMHCAENVFKSTVTDKTYKVQSEEVMTCKTSNLIYLQSCKNCGIQYVGETSCQLNRRMNSHRTGVTNELKNSCRCKHFNFNGHTHCKPSDVTVQPIEKIPDFLEVKNINTRNKMKFNFRKEREDWWMRELWTITPYGLNDDYDGKNWNERGYDETVCKLFHPIDDDHNLKKKKTLQQNKKFKNRNSNTHIKIDATEIMKMVQAIPVDTRMYYRCRRITQSLDKKVANDVFVMVLEMLEDPNRQITRNLLDIMKDLLLHRLMVHTNATVTEKDRPKVFAKILYHSKGMELINMNKILNETTDCIPEYFKHRSAPCVLFTRTNSIRSDILNYRQTIDDIKIHEWKDRPYTCDCHKSEFADPHHKHIVTGDLNVIQNKSLRELLEKGPTYREEQKIDWKAIQNEISKGLTQCKLDWAKKEKVDPAHLDEWKSKTMMKVMTRIRELKLKPTKSVKKILKQKAIKNELIRLQDKYVFTTTDKASNDISVIYKEFNTKHF